MNYLTTALKRGPGGRSSFSGSIVTVFGATSILGRYLVNRLGKLGNQVIIPYRGDPTYYQRLKVCGDLGQILFVPFYLRDLESIYQAVKYSNIVVNLIGKMNETPSFSLEDVHVEGARAIAKISREAGIARLIHVSALNANPNPTPISTRKGSNFHKSKYFGELAVREEFPEATIFRPADMFGPSDNYLNYYALRTKRTPRGDLALWNKGKGIYKRPVYLGDIADAIALAIDEPNSMGLTYDAVGPRQYELADLMEYFSQILNRDASTYRDIVDLRFCVSEWIKITMAESIQKYPSFCWEKTERESTSDVMTPGNPRLEDLGLSLQPIETIALSILFPKRKQSVEGRPPIVYPDYDLPKYTR